MPLPFGYTLNADFFGGMLPFLGLILSSSIFVILTNKAPKFEGTSSRKPHLILIQVLRILSVFLLLLLVFNPQIALTRSQIIPKKIAVIVDRSRSMATSWEGNVDLINEILVDVTKQLEENIEVDVWGMDGELLDRGAVQFTRDVSDFSWDPLDHPADINNSIYQAVFLLSDGQLNGGRSPLDMSWTKDTPMYPIFPLNPVSNTELKITDLNYEFLAEDNSKIQLGVALFSHGLIGEPSSINIFDEGGELVGNKEFNLQGSYRNHTLQLPFQDQTSQKYQVILSHKGSGLRSERHISTATDRPLRSVLLVSERLNELHKFVQINLPDSVNDISIILGTSIASESSISEMLIDLQPDLLILNQPGNKVLSESLYNIIESQISNSTPLILFHDGSEILDARLQEMLSVEQLQAPGNVQKSLVDWGGKAQSHPIVLEMMAGGESIADILKYPPLHRGKYNITAPGANLMVTGGLGEKSPILTIASEQPVAIFNGGDIWKWFFHPQSKDSFLSLWRLLQIYLEEVANFKPVSLSIPQTTAATGAFISFDVTVKNMVNQPIPTAEVRVWQVDSSSDRMALDLSRNSIGKYSGELNTKSPGEIMVIVEAYRFGELWGKDTSRIELVAFNGENQSDGVDENFLARLASRSEAQIIRHGVDELPLFPVESYPLETQSNLRGVRSPVLFVILITSLILEWILRRRNGLL